MNLPVPTPFAPAAYTPFHAVFDETQSLSGRDVVDIWHAVKAFLWQATLRAVSDPVRNFYQRHLTVMPTLLLSDLELGSLHLNGAFAHALMLCTDETLQEAALPALSAQESFELFRKAVDSGLRGVRSDAAARRLVLEQALSQEAAERRNYYGFQITDPSMPAGTLLLPVARYVANSGGDGTVEPDAADAREAASGSATHGPVVRAWYG